MRALRICREDRGVQSTRGGPTRPEVSQKGALEQMDVGFDSILLVLTICLSSLRTYFLSTQGD